MPKFNLSSIMAPIGRPKSIGGAGGGKSDPRVSGGFMPQPAFDPSNLQRQIGGLQEQIGNIPSFDPNQFATRDDLENRPIYDDTALRDQITSIGQRPGFDDSALRSMIEQNANRPGFDSSGLQSQIGGLQEQFKNIPQFDDSQLQSQIGGLQDQFSNMPQFDDSNLRQMIEQNKNRPQFDASGLQSQIGGLQDQFSNMPQFDDSSIRQMIEANKQQIGNIPQFDSSQLQSQIGGLEDRLGNMPQFDDSNLRQMIEQNKNRPQFDPSNLQSGIAGLQDRMQNMPQFDPSQLQNRLKTLEGNKPQDMSGYARKEDLPSFDRQKLIEEIQSGINIPQPQVPDMSAFESRFADMQKRIEGLSQNQINQQLPLGNTGSELVMPEPDPVQYLGGNPNFNEQGPSFDPRQMPAAPIVQRPGMGRPPMPPSIGGPGGGITSIGQIGQDPRIPSMGGMFNSQKDTVGYVDPMMGNRADPSETFADYRRRTGAEPLEDFQARQRAEIIAAGDDPDQQLSAFGGDDPYGLLGGLSKDTSGGDLAVMVYGPDGTRYSSPGAASRAGVTDFSMSPPRTSDSTGRPRGLQDYLNANPRMGNENPVPFDPSNMRQGNANSQLGPLGNIPAVGGTPDDPYGLSEAMRNDTSGGRTGQFIDTDMNGVDDSDQPDFGGPTQMPTGPNQIDPVLLQQATSEQVGDPLLRSLYFGTEDSPGFYNQLQQAGSNLIGSEVPLQQTAGLSPLELLSRKQAVAGLGGFEPFLQQNRDLVNQAISQSRRAEELQDPYYSQAEEIFKDTMGGYDPSMTQQFYNPYEDQVVQQTIDDVMKSGDKQDIAARANEISSGAFGGSRARLGAGERRESLGKGLAQALGNIRSQGFQSAQQTGLGEFARQQQAKRTGAQGLMGIGLGRGSAASNLGQQLAGYGGQMSGIGSTQEGLRAGQRGELSRYGTTGRGIAETGLGRIFEQQVGQQYRPMQTLGQIGSMLPGYQASGSQIDSQYGMPTDPTAAGLGAAFSAYGAMAPRQGQS